MKIVTILSLLLATVCAFSVKFKRSASSGHLHGKPLSVIKFKGDGGIDLDSNFDNLFSHPEVKYRKAIVVSKVSFSITV
jgi:hypothetical protein